MNGNQPSAAAGTGAGALGGLVEHFWRVRENNLLSVKQPPSPPSSLLPVNADKESYIFSFNFPFTLCDFMRRYDGARRVGPGRPRANIAHTKVRAFR